MAKSYGSEKFCKLPVTRAKIALALGLTLPTISKYCSGERTPVPHVRQKIWELWGPSAPEPYEWEDLLDAPPEPPPLEELPPLERATPDAVLDEASEWLRELKRLRREISLLPEPQERARLMADASRVFTSLGKLTGVNLAVSERQILESPHWRRIMGMIIVALEPWPEAVRAVRDALEPQESEKH